MTEQQAYDAWQYEINKRHHPLPSTNSVSRIAFKAGWQAHRLALEELLIYSAHVGDLMYQKIREALVEAEQCQS